MLFLLLFSCNESSVDYKQKAVKALDRGDFTQALIDINKAIKLAPDSVDNYSIRVAIYDLTGQYENELSDLKKIIEMRGTKNKTLNAYHQKAVVELSLGLYKDALQDIDYFIENRDTIGSLAEAFLNKASILYMLEDVDNSCKFYKLAIDNNYEQNIELELQAYIGLANLAQSPQEAFGYLNQVILKDDNHAMAYGSRGELYFNLGKIPEAYSDLTKSLLLNPNDATVNFNIGQLHANYFNNMDSALYYYKKAINLSPESPNNDGVYMNVAIINHNNGKLNDALANFKKAESFNSENDILLFNYAMLLSDLERNKEALDKITKAIEINATDETYFNLKGAILIDMSLMDDAIKEFLKAINLNKNYGGAYYNLGYVYGEQNNHSLSIKYYSKAVDLNFELESTLVNLALQKIKNNNISSACSDLNRAYQLGRTDILPLMNKYCR